MPEPIPDTAQIKTFMNKFETILDPRDNRGKRHALPFVLATVSLAILAGRLQYMIMKDANSISYNWP